MLAVIILIIADTVYCQTYSNTSLAKCGGHTFDCGNGKCISEEAICNTNSDCINGLDEGPFCADLMCSDFAFSCSHVGCLDRDVMCNGISDCASSDEHYLNCPPIQSNCGRFNSSDLRQIFPWHAGVWLEADEGPVKVCAATIITTRFVVSAADCFWNTSANDIIESVFTITGELNNNTFKQARRVKNIYLNDYRSTENETHINNIAVVELEEPFTFNQFISNICMFDYKWLEPIVDSVFNLDKQFVTWTPGPNNYNGPQRLHLGDSSYRLPLFDTNYESEINAETKYVGVAEKCGPLSDHGGGVAIITDGMHFLHGILNPPLGDITVMSCLNRLVTHIVPHIGFIKYIVDFDDDERDAPHETVGAEPGDRYALNVDVVPPDTLFENCGKFDTFDEGVFPWHSVIWQETTAAPEVVCSATIIKENLVISAASCYWDPNVDALAQQTLTATAGLNGERFTQYRAVSRIIVQDYFSTEREENINNVAILVLVEPFTFNAFVGAACLYNPDLVPSIPPPIEREAIIISMEYQCSMRPRQVSMEFRWNRLCDQRATFLPTESFKLCLRSNYDHAGVDNLDCLSLADEGTGLFVVEGGTYFLRGVLNPLRVSEQIFTNILPYVASIADLDEELEWAANASANQRRTYITSAKDLASLIEIPEGGTEFRVDLKQLVFAVTFSNCSSFVQGSCDEQELCEDSLNSFRCMKNGTMQECETIFCRNNYTCKATVSCR